MAPRSLTVLQRFVTHAANGKFNRFCTALHLLRVIIDDAWLLRTLHQHTCEALSVLASARLPNLHLVNIDNPSPKLFDIELRRPIFPYMCILGRAPLIGRYDKACILPEQNMPILHHF
jgi:hypothetical protein